MGSASVRDSLFTSTLSGRERGFPFFIPSPSPSTFRHGSTLRQAQGPQAHQPGSGAKLEAPQTREPGRGLEPAPDLIRGRGSGPQRGISRKLQTDLQPRRTDTLPPGDDDDRFQPLETATTSNTGLCSARISGTWPDERLRAASRLSAERLRWLDCLRQTGRNQAASTPADARRIGVRRRVHEDAVSRETTPRSRIRAMSTAGL